MVIFRKDTNDGLEIELPLFIHYNLNNYELLHYQVRSFQRLMQKSDRLYRSEKILLDFFKTVSGADTKQTRQQQLEVLKKVVTSLFKTYYEKGFSFYFDLECWIESQLSNKDFAQVIAKDKQPSTMAFKA